MTSDNRNNRLAELRRGANSSLRAFNRRNGFVSTGASESQDGIMSSASSQGFSHPASQVGGSQSFGEVTVNVNLMGGAVFIDDERRVRALAKEIKRLIVEDRRRGLGVGG